MHFLDKLHGEGLQQWITTGGYLLLFGIVFAETGLLFGFIFPGDSLLFTAGFLAATGVFELQYLLPVLWAAALLGDSTGYFIGRQAGPTLFSRSDSRFFKRAHLEKARAFYEKHGAKTIILARYVPIVRTFATTVAGAAGMPYRQFLTYSFIGASTWIFLMTLLGYFLGNIPIVKQNLEKVVILIIFLSILPMIIHAIKDRKAGKTGAEGG